jgi:hypothetical protein
MPTVIVPTISPPLPNEDLCLFDDVEATERGSQSLRGAKWSRLEAVGHRPPGNQRDRSCQCQTNPLRGFLHELKLTKLQDTSEFAA